MSITSANSVLLIGVTSLYSVPQQLLGFGVDDGFAIDSIEPVESVMGVDGIMSSGWVPQMKTMHVTLQADSPSISFFEAWYAAQEAAREVYTAFGTISQPGVSRSYTMLNGVLANYTPIAESKKVLGARKFQIRWNTVLGAPL